MFQATVLKFGDSLQVWKLATNTQFQHNISKIMPPRPKNTRTWGVNTSRHVTVCVDQQNHSLLHSVLLLLDYNILIQTIFLPGICLITNLVSAVHHGICYIMRPRGCTESCIIAHPVFLVVLPW